jgi:hypothetical protein
MTRGRRWTIVAVLLVTVATFLVAVLHWGVDSLEQVSWAAGILGLAATIVIALVGQGRQHAAPPGAAAGRRWDRPPVRSGVGAVLGLGALGVTLVAAMALGALAILFR